jgi:hypothetical protein
MTCEMKEIKEFRPWVVCGTWMNYQTAGRTSARDVAQLVKQIALGGTAEVVGTQRRTQAAAAVVNQQF